MRAAGQGGKKTSTNIYMYIHHQMMRISNEARNQMCLYAAGERETRVICEYVFYITNPCNYG